MSHPSRDCSACIEMQNEGGTALWHTCGKQDDQGKPGPLPPKVEEELHEIFRIHRWRMSNTRNHITALQAERDTLAAVCESHNRNIISARLDALRWVQKQAGVVPYPLAGIIEREITRLERLLAPPSEQPHDQA